MSVSKLVKEFGSKIEKEFAGYYIYKGKNFTVKFNSDECVSKYWYVNLYDNCPEIISKELYDYNKFDTKYQLIYELLNIDKNI